MDKSHLKRFSSLRKNYSKIFHLQDSGMITGVTTTRAICAKRSQLKIFQSPRAFTSHGWYTPDIVRAKARPMFPTRVLLLSSTYSIAAKRQLSNWE